MRYLSLIILFFLLSHLQAHPIVLLVEQKIQLIGMIEQKMENGNSESIFIELDSNYLVYQDKKYEIIHQSIQKDTLLTSYHITYFDGNKTKYFSFFIACEGNYIQVIQVNELGDGWFLKTKRIG